MRSICVVTTSRADYGILYWLLREIDADSQMELLLVVAGSHLAAEFGYTVQQITADGFSPRARIEMLLSSDTAVAAAKSTGLGMISFADALQRLCPEVVVLLGDRYELFSFAVPALLSRVPIAHIHGGESTEGALDDAVRHAITKMASVHFPATEAYRNRIVQMGEDPNRVFAYGAPGIDSMYRTETLDRKETSKALGFDLEGTVALITFHPATRASEAPLRQLKTVLAAVESAGIRSIFTKSNADEQGRALNLEIKTFCERNPSRFRVYDSLGTEVYFSCMKHCSLMVGNSSSGLIEAPSLKLPVVNIGDRQKGRVRAKNVIDVPCSTAAITAGIEKACSPEFRNGLIDMQNPYDPHGDGQASVRIKETLKTVELSQALLQKGFVGLGGGSS